MGCLLILTGDACTGGLPGAQDCFGDGWQAGRREMGRADGCINVLFSPAFRHPEEYGLPEGFWGWHHGVTVIGGDTEKERTSKVLEAAEVSSLRIGQGNRALEGWHHGMTVMEIDTKGQHEAVKICDTLK